MRKFLLVSASLGALSLIPAIGFAAETFPVGAELDPLVKNCTRLARVAAGQITRENYPMRRNPSVGNFMNIV